MRGGGYVQVRVRGGGMWLLGTWWFLEIRGTL